MKECKIFGCGEINNGNSIENDFICAHKQINDEGTEIYNIAMCPKTNENDYICNLLYLTSVDIPLKDVNCLVAPIRSKTLSPGDRCLFSDDCFPKTGPLNASCINY